MDAAVFGQAQIEAPKKFNAQDGTNYQRFVVRPGSRVIDGIELLASIIHPKIRGLTFPRNASALAWRSTGYPVESCRPVPLKHKGNAHFEQNRGSELIAGEILIDREFGIRVNLHRMKVEFHARRAVDNPRLTGLAALAPLSLVRSEKIN